MGKMLSVGHRRDTAESYHGRGCSYKIASKSPWPIDPLMWGTTGSSEAISRACVVILD